MKDWADEVMGVQHKRNPVEIANLLGWSLKEQLLGYSKTAIRLLRSPNSLSKLLKRKEIAQKGDHSEAKAYKI